MSEPADASAAAADATAALRRHRRRVAVALLFANVVVVNEVMQLVGPGGLRLPWPTLEHVGRGVLLVLPAMLDAVPLPAASSSPSPSSPAAGSGQPLLERAFITVFGATYLVLAMLAVGVAGWLFLLLLVSV